MSDELNLHTLKPADGSHRERKRVGRGPGSGTGKTSGRGHKGQKSRSGSHYMRAGFEGGQMPIYMRLGKLRGPNHKKSMPMGPFRTHTIPVNVRDLERFDEGVEVTPELLRTAGVVRHLKHPVKILGSGELSKKLTVHAHGFSAKARELIEGAGGTVVVLGAAAEEEAPAKPKRSRAAAPAADAAPAKPKRARAAAPAEETAAPADEAEPAEGAAAVEQPAEETVDDAVAEATDSDVEAGETT
jgi:large subunit ribosomal protein L15